MTPKDITSFVELGMGVGGGRLDYLQLDLFIILYVCLIQFFLLTLFVCI